MAKTRSILGNSDWKSRFGELLAMAAEEQGISADDIGRRLDRLPGSTGRNRAGDWSRYVNKGRIPTKMQLAQLAEVLKIPYQVLRVCAGYVDDIFDCAYSTISGAALPRRLPCSRTRAVFAFLFSLFANDEMHTGNLCELWSFIAGRPVRLNLTGSAGFLTGRNWNSTWLFPAKFRPRDLIERVCDPVNDSVTYVSIDGSVPDSPWVEYSLRAKIQTDIASPLAAAILACDWKPIPKTHPLCEAQRLMHAKALPLILRVEVATVIVHHWANAVDRKVADEIRRDLNCHDYKTITDAAAAWIKGKRRERPEYRDFWL